MRSPTLKPTYALSKPRSHDSSVSVQGDVSERLFQYKVEQIARMNGWQVFHPAPHQVRPGVYRTDGKGFPDLVLAHKSRGLIFAELKTERGKVSPQQKIWALAITPWAEWYLWRPSQIDAIAARLGTTPM